MCNKCNWKDCLAEIDVILSESNKLSKGTVQYLEDVYGWVEEHQHVTPTQWKKVRAIYYQQNL